MKVVGSIKTIDEINDLLLTDELLMSMCGFNAHQVKNGSCERGTKLRRNTISRLILISKFQRLVNYLDSFDANTV